MESDLLNSLAWDIFYILSSTVGYKISTMEYKLYPTEELSTMGYKLLFASLTRFVYLVGYKLYSVTRSIRRGLIFIFFDQSLTNFSLVTCKDYTNET